MIATCLVRQKTSANYKFDYIIPDDLTLELFCLVEVPFLNKKILAVVLEIKEKSSFAKKAIIRKLSSGPLFTDCQLEIAKKIAFEFLSNESSALFSFLPGLNIKDLATLGTTSNVKKMRNSEVKFLEAVFSDRLLYYFEACDKEAQNLIILPEGRLINKSAARLRRLDPSREILLWNASISRHEKAKIWNKLLSGGACTILASRHGLFLPFTNLKNVFLDQPSSFGYFEDQDPRYNAYQASKIVQKTYGCNLIFGDSMYSPQLFAQIKNKMIGKISLENRIKIEKAPELSKAFASENLLPETNKARKILVTGFFKEFIRIICADCKTQLNCQNCNGELYSDSSHLCLKCHAPSSLTCPSCKRSSLKPTGFSLSKIKREIEESFQAKTSLAPDNKEKITICSLKDLDSLKPIYDLAIFPYFDIYNQFPVLNLKFELLRKMKGLSDFGIRKIFILTKNNNLLADQIVGNEWEKIVLNELKQRKLEEMPPFTRYFEIESNNKFFNQIQELIPERLIQRDENSYVALLPHKLVLKIQNLFDSKSIKAKARLDSPDFS